MKPLFVESVKPEYSCCKEPNLPLFTHMLKVKILAFVGVPYVLVKLALADERKRKLLSIVYTPPCPEDPAKILLFNIAIKLSYE
jgi:hypothetical protein